VVVDHATGWDRTWADRVRGSLLLSACGDALGAPFEGATRIDPAEVDQWLDEPVAPLRWTDDTAMTLVLAGHLARRGGTVDEADLAGEFAAEWTREPDRGYGPGAARVLAAITGGTPWAQAARGLFDGAGSYGNGAAMRVAPVGLVAGLGPSAVAARARRSAAVTHAHPLGQDGAAVQAVAVAVAARTPTSGGLDADAFLAQVAAYTGTGEFRAALQRIAALTRRGTTPPEVAAQLGNDVSALGSVPAALAAFLTHPDDAYSAIGFAVRIGGDTDTIAAMTGALCGARGGTHAVPHQWQRRLEADDRVTALATDLARLPAHAGSDQHSGQVPFPDRTG
jgi:poly(ADP-ribose) glycohydrolase ARH3